MNILLRVIVLCIGISPLISSSLHGQDQSRHTGHSHATFRQIDSDFQKGQLTLDQKVLYKLYVVHAPRKLPADYRQQHTQPIKCGTPAVIELQANRQHLSPESVREVETLMSHRLQIMDTHLSPSGRFRIAYDTTGTDAVPAEDLNQNAVPDYVEEVAAAADSSYRHQVETLGYSDPLNNGAIYEIRISNLPCGSGCYGYTGIEDNSTFIEIENDFVGFPSNTHPEGDQLGAVKATMAHEFKHAIQYAATGWGGETDLWAEMDATLMEEVVYDDVNDYYNYLRNPSSIFNSPGESFYPGSYYDVSWALYFEERYGPLFWPGVWDIIEANPEIRMAEALRRQLGESSSFTQSFTESYLWHYASGEFRSAEGYGFEESREYPAPAINFTLSGEDSLATPIEVTAFSGNYIEFTPGPRREGYLQIDFNFTGDTLGIGLLAQLQDGSVESRLRTVEGGGAGTRTETANWRWNDIERLGIVFANSSESDSTSYTLKVYPNIPEQLALIQNYPNPFNARTTIEYSLPQDTEVQLKIYDTAGRLVQTLRDEQLSAGYYEETFDGSGLASGIYFYQLITGRETIVKQMTLIKSGNN